MTETLKPCPFCGGEELAILRAEVTRLRQINAGNEAAAVAQIAAWLRTGKAVSGYTMDLHDAGDQDVDASFLGGLSDG